MHFLNGLLICSVTVLVQVVKLQSVDCPDIKNLTVRIDKQYHGLGQEEIINGCIEAGKFSLKEDVLRIKIRCSETSVLENLGMHYVRNLPKLQRLDIERCPIGNMEPQAFKDVPTLTEIYISGEYNIPEFTQVFKKDIFIGIPSLRAIDIDHLNIVKIKDEAFSNLSQLNLIRIHDNKIGIISEDWFSDGNNVDSLMLWRNTIQIIESGVFKHLSKLTLLNIEYNQINLIELDAFQGLTNLETLRLRNNSIQIIQNGLLKYLSRLERLELQNNQISVIEIDAFQNLNDLKYLLLGDNLMQILRNGVFKYLGSLEYLDLDNNRITTIEVDAFQGLKYLDKLYVPHNLIQVLPSGVFRDLPNLILLDLSFNQITSVEANAFQGLTSLDILHLNDNWIQFLLRGAFKHLSKVAFLYLNNNQIISIDADTFKGLTYLYYLYLGDNRITSKSMEGLFSITAKPELISLNNNEINYLTESFLEKTLKIGMRLDISGNPLVCSCLDDILSWMYKNNITYELSLYLLSRYDNYPVCIVDRNNIKECPMTVQPKLTAYYKFKIFEYMNVPIKKVGFR